MSNLSKVQAYYNWSLHALLGAGLGQSDQYLLENLEVIKEVALNLLYDMEIKPQEIYRGLLMDSPGLTELPPHENYHSLSFSEDINIAQLFADVNGFGSEFGLNAKLGNHGYIIAYQPKLEEILFHHCFLEVLPYRQHMTEMVGSVKNTVDVQKEVIIMQPAGPLKLSHYKSAEPLNNFPNLKHIFI